MPVDWVALGLKALGFVRPVAQGAKAAYDRIVGKRPTIDFEVGEYGPHLRIINTRSETIIVERIQSNPPLFGFGRSDSHRDIMEGIFDQQRAPRHAATVLKPGQEQYFTAFTMKPLDEVAPEDTIRVRVFWRTAKRSLFSNSYASCKISVNDYLDLQHESDRERQRRK